MSFPRACPKPDCPGTVDDDPDAACTVCGWTRAKVTRESKQERDKQRGTRTERGYDNEWLRLRERKLAADPLCEECDKNGDVEFAVEVHHKIPFRGKNDSLRLDYSNLQSLCKRCHSRKTAKFGRVPLSQ